MSGVRFLFFGAAFGFILMVWFNPMANFDDSRFYGDNVVALSIDDKFNANDWERLEGGFGNSYGESGTCLNRIASDDSGGN